MNISGAGALPLRALSGGGIFEPATAAVLPHDDRHEESDNKHAHRFPRVGARDPPASDSRVGFDSAEIDSGLWLLKRRKLNNPPSSKWRHVVWSARALPWRWMHLGW